MILGCMFHDCKLDVVIVQENLRGDSYRHDIRDQIVMKYFDNRPLHER